MDFKTYIVNEKPEVLNKVLASYGLPEPESVEEACEALDMLLAEHGEEALIALAQEEVKLNGVDDNGDKKGIDRVAYEINKSFKKLPGWAQLLIWGVAGYSIVNQFFRKS